MLCALHIRNYVLIDSLDITFPEGLVIITGQTGAGKSILLGALGMLLGGKADASAISEGAESCVVEADFDAPASVRHIIDDVDAEWNGGHLTIRRTVHSSGRSRSFVNDCPVTVQVLQELASGLVDIHSQHQSLLLRDKAWQLALLDHYSGCSDISEKTRSCWRSLQEARKDLKAAREEAARLSADSEYNEARYRRLADASLKEGELEELEAEHQSLAHSEDIKENISSILSLCSSDERSVGSDLREAERLLGKLSSYLPSAGELGTRLESARIEIEDILSEVESAGEKINLSSDRMEAVESRLSLIYDLLKKYNCATVGELIAERDRYSAAVNGTGELEDRIAELGRNCDALQASYESMCAELNSIRSAACGKFSETVQKLVRDLELDKAVFRVELRPSEPGPSGTDAVDFLFSANGTVPEDVSRCASGGEMSRIMLCLKAMMARYVKMPTLIFDEIDTGVSGSAAAAMGSMICSMGREMQLISITHLPQVAAKGTAHYLVSKEEDVLGRVTTSITRLEGEDRVREIARLLSGATLSDAALANARVLLSE